jgi:cell division protein FtsW (lipid II flippase)
MLLKGDPRWTHRRRLVYVVTGFSLLMLTVAMLDFTDRQVSSQLVIGAVSLLSLVLGTYNVMATYDDKWRADHEPSDYGP